MMLTALGLYAWGQRQKQSIFGLAAAALWLSHPLIVWLSESGYVDLGVTGLAFLGVYALRVFWDEGEVRWWYLGMALLGAAAGVKLTGLAFVGIGAGLGLWACVRSELSWRNLVRGWAVGLLVLAPFYGFLAYQTGDPVWPLLPQLGRGVWGAPRVVNWNKGLFNWGVPKTLLNYLLLPVKFIMHPAPFVPERPLLTVMIAWPIAWIIAWWNRSVRWWTLWALAFTGVWFLSSQQLRYWLPALPLAGLALCESLRWLSARSWRSAVFQQVVWTSLALWSVFVGAQYVLGDLRYKGWPPTTPQARESFLSTYLAGYPGTKYVNDHAQQNDVVYIMNGGWLSYYVQAQAVDLSGMLQGARPTFSWPQDETWVQKLESLHITWLLFYQAERPFWITLPKDNPSYRPAWPPYQLVYEDPQVWVYHRSPSQGE